MKSTGAEENRVVHANGEKEMRFKFGTWSEESIDVLASIGSLDLLGIVLVVTIAEQVQKQQAC